MSLTRDALFWNSFRSHAEKSVKAVALLEEMLANPREAQALYRKIGALEGEGDTITREVVQALHRTWITPLDREAIHALISKLDDVLDYIDACAERVALYEIVEVRPEAREMMSIIAKAVNEVDQAVRGLTNMKDAARILDLCSSVNKHESACDSLYRLAVARLFKERGDPIELMKWRDIFDSIESACDRLEDVADIIEGIILEHA